MVSDTLSCVCFGFLGPHVFPCFIHMALWCLGCFGIVSCDIAFGEERPTHKVASLDCLESGGLDGVAAHDVHSLDCLFCGC